MPHASVPARDVDRSRASAGFTLIELLVTIAIIAVLMSLLVPAAFRTIEAGRGFKCQIALRSTAFDFAMFADGALHPDRGDDHELGPHRFRLETFQESVYGIDEFWNWGDQPIKTFPDAGGNDPMRCPSVAGELVLRRDVPCSRGGVGPPESVSFTFNLRLHRAEVRDRNGNPRAVPVQLTESITQASNVPLAWDAAGRVAQANGVTPVFSAPALDSVIFANDRYWFPGARHNGSANYVFIDGHVSASGRPLSEVGWDWAYQPVQ